MRGVYFIFLFFGIFVHGYVCRYAIVDVPMRSETIRCIAEYSSGFWCLGAYDGEDGCPEFEDAVHQGYWSVVRLVIWVFVLFVYELCGACALFLGGVGVFSHDCEEGVDDVVCFIGEEFTDLVRYGVRSRCLSRGCPPTRNGVVCFGKDFVKG
jgi:hypothetical protein